ncbi:SixA phosphatase family protein [Donghicola tyrosinivorans]|uniref:Phosphohistidine phosphatase n=1 Tax=Donghicola tyrosinivorans TaxID=1652492 RepID=A0A2T0X043_9RHOB|nr:histidine phosphatase family protein [Donghicola tyrosinivorans]PRY92214.1 phosphohistidine phosphatase [Donghicola tyrosinivorans]
MTLRLILMRHAKSAWDDPLMEDHDRVLNARGQRSAQAMGDWLRDKDCLPGQVLCSSATRTRETLDQLKLPEAETDYLRRLYLAGSDVMMEVLQSAEAQTVLMLGHNPGIAEFAARLLAHAPDHPQFRRYPTCATLVADFPQNDWGAVRFHTAHPVDFIVPRELTD